MKYFKHSELVNEYHVSLKTVHNWIDATKQGKLDLQLHTEKNKTYIANTPTNLVTIDALANKGKKYRNTLHHKVVTPKPEFYDLYTSRQILDIISNLNIHHEIPRQYNYMDGGADNWDSWLQRLEKEETSNILKGTIKLMNDNLTPLDQLIGNSNKINVIDVGVGNAAPVKELLGHLLEKDLLNRYIAIDISVSAMNDLTTYWSMICWAASRTARLTWSYSWAARQLTSATPPMSFELFMAVWGIEICLWLLIKQTPKIQDVILISGMVSLDFRQTIASS